MFNIGGLARSLINPANLAQLAMGPAGWAGFAMRTIGPQLAMNAIQQLGTQLGLPQTMIDVAQAAFADRIGMGGLERMNVNQAVRGFAAEAGLNAFETGALMRSVDGSFSNLMELINDGLRRSDRNTDPRALAQGGQSFLVAIAMALGEVMDQKLDKMYELSTEISDLDTDNSEYGAKTAELQATGKELDFVGQALNNSLKSIGEAVSTVARKN